MGESKYEIIDTIDRITEEERKLKEYIVERESQQETLTYEEERIDLEQEENKEIGRLGSILFSIILSIVILIIDQRHLFHRELHLLQYICSCILYSLFQSIIVISWVKEKKICMQFITKYRIIQGTLCCCLILMFSLSMYMIAFTPREIHPIWYYLYGASLYLAPANIVIETIKDNIEGKEKTTPLRGKIAELIMIALFLIWITRGYVLENHPPIQSLDTVVLQNKTELLLNPREMLYKEPFDERSFYDIYGIDVDSYYAGATLATLDVKLSAEDEAMIMKQISDNGVITSISGVEYMGYRRKIRQEDYTLFNIKGSKDIYLVMIENQEAYLHQLDLQGNRSLIKFKITRPIVYPITLNSEIYQLIERYDATVG